ncbi:hypothetical protein [Streptomyces sp. cg40]|uniref:hypothetical protein n=1 Tax=Streptomyces sp. cg40 TaxID=3419764 RepID=UPI003D0818A7
MTKEDPNGQFWGWSQVKHAAWSATNATAKQPWSTRGGSAASTIWPRAARTMLIELPGRLRAPNPRRPLGT